MANDPFAKSIDNRPPASSPMPEAKRKTGFQATQEPHEYANQAIFESVTDHIWGTQNQTLTDDATFYTDSAGNPFNKNDDAVTLVDDDKILVVHDTALTANLKLDPVSSIRLNIEMFRGTEIDFSDAGGGVPYKLILGTNIKTGSNIKIRGTQEFIDLIFSLTDDQKRFISNQSIGTRIQYNEDVIYDPAHVGDVVTKDSYPANPYLARMNGQQLNWKLHVTPATNNILAWFRDLNKFLHGYRDGSEEASRFTLPAIISASPHLFQVNTPNGILRDISVVDPDIHSRTDANGVSVAVTADFVNTSSTVTIQGSIGNVKNFMRINGADARGIPDGSSGTPGTTILVDIDATARTATMVDALTFTPVTATSTGSTAVTMDNSGAAGGSLQLDAGQGHIHKPTVANVDGSVDLVVGLSIARRDSLNDDLGDTGLGGERLWKTGIPRDDGTNGIPRTALVTRDNSTDVFYFYQG